MTDKVFSNSRELWHALQSEAGLSLPEGDVSFSYDSAFEGELRDSLLGGAEGDFGDLLDAHDITPARLLTAFFRALAPFARMMSEILAMFEMAGAARSDKNLRIAVDTEDVDAPLNFDLSSFREVVRRLEGIVRMVDRRSWTYELGWSLDTIIMESGAIPGLDSWVDRPSSSSPEMQAWLERAVTDRDFADLPSLIPTGVPDFDNLARDLWSDFNDFQGALRERFGSYSRLSSAPSVSPNFRGWDWKLLRFASHDLWPRRTVELLDLLGDVLRRNPSDPTALKCVADLKAHVAKFTTRPQPMTVQIEVLEDILSLPAWKRRHELYAVWVASLIVETLGPFEVEFHCSDGVLSFPFKATRLASIGKSGRTRLELWSELRSPAIDPVGHRFASVQPDYRLRFPSDTAGTLQSDGDVLIIECKQYRRSSTRNFAAALTDYAKAAPGAQVMLCNYGRVGSRVLQAVDRGVVDRCHAVGDVQPTGMGLAEAKRVLLCTGQGAFGRALAPYWLMDKIRVELRWEGEGVDLDLFITTTDAACGYDSPHDLTDATFESDNLGVESGRHVERMTLSPTGSDRYDIVARAHSGASDFRGLGSEVLIRWRDTKNHEHVRIISLSSANARDWHVASFLRGSKEPDVIDLPAEGFVSGRGWRP